MTRLKLLAMVRTMQLYKRKYVAATVALASSLTALYISAASGILPLPAWASGIFNENIFVFGGKHAALPNAVVVAAASASGQALKSTGTAVTNIPNFGALDLSGGSNIFSNFLPIAQGGTNNSATSVTNGNVIVTDGSKMIGLAAGKEERELLIASGIPAYGDRKIEPSIWAPLRMMFTFTPSNTGAASGISNNSGVSPVQAGTATNATDADGIFLKWTTTAVNNNAAGCLTGATMTMGQLNPRTWIHFKTGTSISVCRIWIALTSADLSAVSSPTTQKVIGLRYDTVAGDTTWRLITCDGASNVTNVDTGITPLVTTDYTVCYDQLVNTKVDCYLSVSGADATKVATSSTNLPSASIGLAWQTYITTLEAVAKEIRWGGTICTQKS